MQMLLPSAVILKIFIQSLALTTASSLLYPEQVHIAFGPNSTSMAVQWAIRDNATCSTSSKVRVVSTVDGTQWIAEGDCFPFSLQDNLKQSHHVVNLTNLAESTVYNYSIITNSSVADENNASFYFMTSASSTKNNLILPQKFIVYGDMGSSDSTPSDSCTIMPAVAKEIREERVDQILHVGDFAYNFEDENGERGARFMNDIQNISAYIPYMVSCGNHEAPRNFAHYTEFFRLMPTSTPWLTTDNGPAPNTHYYSWNVGLVHFVAISTEIPFDYPALITNMTSWLKEDLQNVNRSETPWIIVHGHRSLYCSCDSDCDDNRLRLIFAQIFYDYGVDLFINGHEHNYERMYDIAPHPINSTSGFTTQSTTDMPATTYIVTGAAGSDENHESFKRPLPPRTAYRTDAYGYSRMQIYNETHLYWAQVEYDYSAGILGDVVDEVW
eukprot:CAMPEP_0197316426 /NCGR_PEP_ID=MMETSP0891-20130614/42762_1 /TAXON_ID=44058 ORGANISM="Aureoumbra lagunensis, Strain CCMP1510" /NCGR_SAMPLE_ID=MMETSP0891 /ASSEMBLY_ACC=CAM_ASM_000534 /LENGTH=440 /DNA_ID=CAMNT_0042805893 /DNA_START=95 /DNA_END=1414 /DNA_ORIENTATION=+